VTNIIKTDFVEQKFILKKKYNYEEHAMSMGL